MSEPSIFKWAGDLVLAAAWPFLWNSTWPCEPITLPLWFPNRCLSDPFCANWGITYIYIYTRIYVYTHNLHLISSTNKPHLALHVADVFQAQLGANSIDIPNLHSKRTTCWFQNPNRHLLYITRRATCNIYRPIPNPEITPPFHRVSFRHATGSTVSSAWITSSSSKALMTWQIPSCKAFKPRLNDKSFLQNQRQRPAVFKIQNKSRRTSAESSLQLGFHWLNMRKESIAQSFASARHGALARKALVP